MSGVDEELAGDRAERVIAVLDGYLRDLEEGRARDPAELQRAHPELADQLGPYLDTLEGLQRAGARLRDPIEPERTDDPVPGGGRLGDYEIVREVARRVAHPFRNRRCSRSPGHVPGDGRSRTGAVGSRPITVLKPERQTRNQKHSRQSLHQVEP